MTKISIISLGCAKNLVHSEHMMAQFEGTNYEITDCYDEAEIIVINTCGFITSAKEESINTILEMAQLKSSGNCKTLIALGCMVQKYAQEMAEELPEVDLFIGTNNYNDLVAVLEQYFATDQQQMIQVTKEWKPEDTLPSKRVVTTPKHYAYLRIAEGCDNYCTYCTIPQMQGPFRSRPIESIIAEAQVLADSGHHELILVAQDTTYYGQDLYGKFTLAELLKQLAAIQNVKWIRILYAYPNNFTDELIEVIAQEDKVCKYLDIPLQHADDQILRKMNRKITQQDIKALIHKLRQRIPNITLRSTFIVGFPGETQEQFDNLVQFLEDAQLDCVGAFPYSQEEGTVAGKMPDQLTDDLKELRAVELMDAQYDIMYKKHQAAIGTLRVVKVEECSPDVEGLLLCRSEHEAPDVDPLVLVFDDWTHNVGDYFQVKIIGVDEYDLIGEVTNEPA